MAAAKRAATGPCADRRTSATSLADRAGRASPRTASARLHPSASGGLSAFEMGRCRSRESLECEALQRNGQVHRAPGKETFAALERISHGTHRPEIRRHLGGVSRTDQKRGQARGQVARSRASGRGGGLCDVG
ncbi:hypothetical protein ACO7_70072 [Thiomonas arsenitoxydans]|nr:hypothetical protein THICB6_150070 [Thiomonas arsenitoxydans]CQR41203.1 hypothetical protein ACO7_70072 [Thiomonas arsenitoxydans]